MRKVIVSLLVGVLSMLSIVVNADPIGDARTAAMALFSQKKYVECQAAYEQLVATYPDSNINNLLLDNYFIADCQGRQKKFVDAQATCEKALALYANAIPNELALVEYELGDLLVFQGKKVEANKIYMGVITKYVWQIGATDTNSIITGVFDKINPALMTPAEYKDFLSSVIQATSATEGNAKFLGRLKSEIEKIK